MMEILNHVSAAAGAALVAAVWEGLLLAAGVAVMLRLLPGLTAAARSAVWSAVMGIAVLLPFAHLSGRGAAAVAGSKQLHMDERWSVALLCVWVAVSLVRAVQLISSAVYLRRVARNARPIEVEAEIGALLEHRRLVRLCESEEVDRPSVVGFSASKILLPSRLLQTLSGSELRQIVLHEMEHLRRGDDWTNLLQKLCLVVFPLNPVLIWIERRLCLERELACDDQVLRATKARKAYAACLASLAEHSMVRRGVSLALGAWERQPELVKRVQRILSRTRNEMGRAQVAVAVSVMLCGLMVGADALARSPELVSFAPVAGMSDALAVQTPMSQVRDMGRPEGSGLMGGHVTLASAIVPTRHAEGAAAVKRRRHSVRTVRRLTEPFTSVYGVGWQTTGRRSTAGPTVVLVGWRQVEGETGSPVVQTSGFSYAAVPVRNGWLVFQL